MWALAFALYGGCKWLTWRRTPIRDVPAWRHFAYLFAWPGMDAAAFLNPRAVSPKPPACEWLAAAARLFLGLGGLFGAARLILPRFPYAAGWVTMVSIVLVLHFGIFHLLSCVWRNAGVQASPLMDRPLACSGVGDFWGRRWNTAFRDLTHRFLFRPLTVWLGPRPALLAGFLFSGLIHELVISVPAGGGYGGPTVFFVLQGVAVFVEHSWLGHRAKLGRGWTGWLFAVLVLVIPVCILFHPAFLLKVILPFLRALGGVS
jgi:alginate O-acetyltransferase complex protein AlgI